MTVSAREVIARHRPDMLEGRVGRVVEDTSDFTSIAQGDVMLLGGRHYLVLRDEAERRFGLEDPKFWVKRCVCLETGNKNIVKLVFHEVFDVELGSVKARCFRSPEKEARILDMVAGDHRFMQGFSLPDARGNLVRCLEFIPGRRLDTQVENMPMEHRDYFRDHLPSILARFVECCRAIGLLHDHNTLHGDIRRDHVWVEHGSGMWRWIDFDYAYEYYENPFGLDVFGLGNILQFLVGKGEHTVQTMATGFSPMPVQDLYQDDFSLVFRNRLVNLRKLYPYISEDLNRVLMHFSMGAEVYYETVAELLEDLEPCVARLEGQRE